MDKNARAAETEPLRKLFTKSIVARHDLAAGTVLAAEHLAIKKPGLGLPEEKLGTVLNRKLKSAVEADGLITEDNLE